MSSDAPNQLLREHDQDCEARDDDGQLDARQVCHCRDRADIAAAKAAGPVFLDLDDLDGLEDALHAAQETCPDCGREKGCNADCEDMNCDHCYCYRDGRDG